MSDQLMSCHCHQWYYFHLFTRSLSTHWIKLWNQDFIFFRAQNHGQKKNFYLHLLNFKIVHPYIPRNSGVADQWPVAPPVVAAELTDFAAHVLAREMSFIAFDRRLSLPFRSLFVESNPSFDWESTHKDYDSQECHFLCHDFCSVDHVAEVQLDLIS